MSQKEKINQVFYAIRLCLYGIIDRDIQLKMKIVNAFTIQMHHHSSIFLALSSVALLCLAHNLDHP